MTLDLKMEGPSFVAGIREDLNPESSTGREVRQRLVSGDLFGHPSCLQLDFLHALEGSQGHGAMGVSI